MTPTRASSRWLAPVRPSVAVDISSRRVTVVEVAQSGQGLVVSAAASEALPPDAVVPAMLGTNIAAPDVVADAVRAAFDRAGIRSPSRAALVVPDAIARVSILPFQQLPGRTAELEELIRWQLRKTTPFPIEEAQLSYARIRGDAEGALVAAVVARRDVVAQYEAVAARVGIHAGIVDLASFNVLNTVMASGQTGPADWLVVCLAPEGTTLAIMRGQDLMFYRHRGTLDEEPLSALVHQTAMFYEDRLQGARFARVWICGAATAPGGAAAVKQEIADRLGVTVEPVDVRVVATLRDRIGAGADVLDTLAAPVGVLVRDRKAA